MANHEQIQQEADAMKNRLIETRRDFHMHPELGFKETRTAGIVAARMNELGYEVATGVGKTGVVAVMEGGHAGSDVLLVRFDMDALPIDEAVDIPFKSKTPGVMHACGHDAHTAVGLGVAEIMARHRDAWKGTIKFVFQPAEEMIAGAKAMIADGVLTNPKPTRTLSMHVNSMEPVGKVMMTDGPSMAGGDPFNVTITGKGTHGAAPHLGIDPIFAAAQVISAMQSIVSRNVNPLESAVITFGSIHGGAAGNVIPDQVKLQGTLRTFEQPIRELAQRRIKEVVEGVAASLGCTGELTWGEMRVPATSSDANFAELVRKNAKAMRSVNEIDTHQRTMGSEDCSWFLEAAAGAYVNIGAAMHKEGERMPHHSPRFEIHEDSLPIAVALLSKTAMDMLKD